MLRVAAYCRVSTEKEEQLDSLKHQIEYFEGFARNNGYELIGIYADEGISGKQMKNRTRFLEMLKDAQAHKFDTILVKDISRFARNTLDFLSATRKLKAIGIDIRFINNSQTAVEGSEFMLTMLAAMAQEESARLSERIKWGKNINAAKGRVPNFVYGYDKVDNFTLTINQTESETVKKMYSLLINESYSTARIAGHLNECGIPTKKGTAQGWYQKTVIEILRNPIYTGKIVNKKSEISDFITGARRRLGQEKQVVTARPEISVIDDDTYIIAMDILRVRSDKYRCKGVRDSTKHIFSNLLKCKVCGYSFRRIVRKYSENGKEHILWACSMRNAKGVGACSNETVIAEEQLLNFINQNIKAFLNINTGMASKISRDISQKLNAGRRYITKPRIVEKAVEAYIGDEMKLARILNFNNQELKRLIDKIQVSSDNEVEIFLL